MDNGLIFPYPCMCVHDESIVLTIQSRRDRSLRGEALTGLRGTPVGSSQAMG